MGDKPGSLVLLPADGIDIVKNIPLGCKNLGRLSVAVNVTAEPEPVVCSTVHQLLPELGMEGCCNRNLTEIIGNPKGNGTDNQGHQK